MTATTETERKPLEYYLALDYPFHATADEDGGWVVIFPDLPGCMTQADTMEELAYMAEDARRGWLEVEYELGEPIPLPSYPPEHSGKFNVRLPRSLHGELVRAAEREGVSLNHYVSAVLAGAVGFGLPGERSHQQ